MLTTSQSAAIHCALILGLPEPEAAKLAGIPIDQAQNAIGQAAQAIRGRRIDFSRWLTGGDSVKDPVQGDSRLLFYEIQLGRLEYQHDECVGGWRRTKEHADKLHEQLPNPLDADGNPKKPFVGDIRFLQLAKNIRREMEKLITDRIEELQKQQQSTNQPTVSASPTREASPSLAPTPESLHPSPLVSNPNKFPSGESLTYPAVHGGDEKVTPYTRKPIPTIEPPPRKRDKYAGVHR
jgi:hypothetical protein